MSGIDDKPSDTGSRSSDPALEPRVYNAFRTSALDDIHEESRQWFIALQRRDCKWLMQLLHKHPQLWLKTGEEDRTVLHVAVIQGCVELVLQVLKPQHVDRSSRMDFEKNLKKFLYLKDGKCKTHAFFLAAIVGNQEVIKILDSFESSKFVNARASGVGLSPRSSSKALCLNVDSSELQIPDSSRHHIGIINATDDSSLSTHNTQLVSRDEDDIIKLIQESLNSESHEELQRKFKRDVDYNFHKNRKALIFNYACKRAWTNRDFIKSVAVKAKEKPGLIQKLFNLRDAQGRTPLHVATNYCMGRELEGIEVLLGLMPNECVNGHDGAGRTPLLRAVANALNFVPSQVVRVLAKDKRTNLNAEWPGGSGATALHLAVLHNRGHAAKYVLEAKRDDEKQCANVEKQAKRLIKVYKYQVYSKWTPLELGVVMGRSPVLNQLLHASRRDHKLIKYQHCLHLAAAAGDPRSIGTLLMNGNGDLQKFESNSHFGGYSSLHFAVYATLPSIYQPFHDTKSPRPIDETFDRFLSFLDYADIHWLQQEFSRASNREGENKGRKIGMHVIGYGDKKACISLLLQAGVDIWPIDNILKSPPNANAQNLLDMEEDSLYGYKDSSHDHRDFHVVKSIDNIQDIPDAGYDAPPDARLWWYELIAKETLEAKNNFNAAGNATAVMATLVATASFIGPLQPPLGYGSDMSSTWTLDQVQVTKLSVRIFMASNSLSFYLAISSIMLAIMPSLPMPQEGVREELHRSRRTVALAISVLFLSIIGILISFTSSVIAVMPSHSWNLKFYPTFTGGIVCTIVIVLFFLRLLRLIFNRNLKIKAFYRLFGKL